MSCFTFFINHFVLLMNKLFNFLDVLSSEKNNMSKNPIYLDHCYYKDFPPNTSESYRNSLSSEMQNMTSK